MLKTHGDVGVIEWRFMPGLTYQSRATTTAPEWAQPGHHLTGHHNKTIKKPPELECLQKVSQHYKNDKTDQAQGAKKNLAKIFINKSSICRRIALVPQYPVQ